MKRHKKVLKVTLHLSFYIISTFKCLRILNYSESKILTSEKTLWFAQIHNIGQWICQRYCIQLYTFEVTGKKIALSLKVFRKGNKHGLVWWNISVILCKELSKSIYWKSTRSVGRFGYSNLFLEHPIFLYPFLYSPVPRGNNVSTSNWFHVAYSQKWWQRSIINTKDLVTQLNLRNSNIEIKAYNVFNKFFTLNI